MNAPNDPRGPKVLVYKIVNKLRLKLGIETRLPTSGHLDPRNIAEADKLIAALCADCLPTIGKHLQQLDKFWGEMKDMPESDRRDELSQQIFTVAHEIKDISSMCGYELIAFFAESLRDYIDLAEPSLKAQRIIVQAHIDAMSTTHKQGLKSDGGPIADELKNMVKIAVEKYR